MVARASLVSSSSGSSSERAWVHMAEVLVLAEHTADGEVKKVTCELLTAARRLGSPSVVWTGSGVDAGVAPDGAREQEKRAHRSRLPAGEGGGISIGGSRQNFV